MIIIFYCLPGHSRVNLNNTHDFSPFDNPHLSLCKSSSCTQISAYSFSSFQPSSMAQNNKANSTTSSLAELEDTISNLAPVFQAPSNLPRPERKLTKEERDYLTTRLPEYHALQSTLSERADGPRGVKNVKGKKKDWIKTYIFEDFKKKFDSVAPGGPALDSLFKVRSLLCISCFSFIILLFNRKFVFGSTTIVTKLLGPVNVQ